MKDKAKRGRYLANGLLAGVALYYAFHLSSTERTAVDWALIGLVVAALLWNLVQVCRDLGE